MQVAVLHILAYYLGYRMARATVASNDVPLARCISLESGMQSSLLGLLLASRFFRDPLVSLPCGISTIFMTLVGCFGVLLMKCNVYDQDRVCAVHPFSQCRLKPALG